MARSLLKVILPRMKHGIKKETIDVLAKLLLVDGDWSGDGEPKV